MSKPLQAVVVIHGMGEQFPMQTLQGFVETVWSHDLSLDPRSQHENKVWAKPNRLGGLFDLNRITTNNLKGSKRTDFYEFYWAHHMSGTTPAQLISWIVSLLFRNPITKVPPNVRLAWSVLWMFTIAIAFSLSYPYLNKWFGVELPGKWPIIIGVFGFLSWCLISRFLVKNFGDVARYVKGRPYNIKVRQDIREQGVKLIEALSNQKQNDDPNKFRYDRIIVVAHSLGSIVAYDVLNFAFGLRNKEFDNRRNPQLEPERDALERMIMEAEQAGEFNLTAFREQQMKARKELNKRGHRWIVSDFITLGAPLTHAEFLIADDADDLRTRQRDRIFPTCPPQMEYDKDTESKHFTFTKGGITKHYLRQEGNSSKHQQTDIPRTPHHAALFAYTRWTNIFSPHRWIICGDLVSGPVAKVFGLKSRSGKVISGVKDIQVLPEKGKPFGPIFTHLRYWKCDPEKPVPHHIKELRLALNLGEK